MIQEGDSVVPFHAVVVDLSHGKRCNYHVWAVVGIVEQIVKPARRLLPHTQYVLRRALLLLRPLFVCSHRM